MKILLWISLIISIITYSFWGMIKEQTGVSIFYMGNALFIFLICGYIYIQDKNSLVKFLFIEFSFINLIKELFLDPTKLELREALIIVIAPLIWYLRKNGKHNRLLERD